MTDDSRTPPTPSHIEPRDARISLSGHTLASCVPGCPVCAATSIRLDAQRRQCVRCGHILSLVFGYESWRVFMEAGRG